MYYHILFDNPDFVLSDFVLNDGVHPFNTKWCTPAQDEM